MGKPLKIGGKHKRYDKVADDTKYKERLAIALGERKVHQGRRTRMKIIDGKVVTEVIDK